MAKGRSRSAWDGPMFGTATLTLTFPLGDGKDVREVEHIVAGMLASAVQSGIMPKGSTLDGWEMAARPEADEKRRRARMRRAAEKREREAWPTALVTPEARNA